MRPALPHPGEAGPVDSMQAPALISASLDLFGVQPTVGQLMVLCEENYSGLMRLAPELARLRGPYVSRADAGAHLLLDVREQAPFTTTLRLTHLFAGSNEPGSWRSEPDAVLRAYHDAGQVEVLDLCQTALPVFRHYRAPALHAKWKVNLFLAKWLSYCLLRGHRFPSSVSEASGHRLRELTPSVP